MPVRLARHTYLFCTAVPVVCEGGGCWRGKAVQRLLLLCHSSSLRFALWSSPAPIVSYRCCKRLEQQDAQKVFHCSCVGWRNCPPAQHILPSLRALLCTNFVIWCRVRLRSVSVFTSSLYNSQAGWAECCLHAAAVGDICVLVCCCWCIFISVCCMAAQGVFCCTERKLQHARLLRWLLVVRCAVRVFDHRH